MKLEQEIVFQCTEEQRNNINKRLPVGFSLCRISERYKMKNDFKGQIQYIPVKKAAKIASQTLQNAFAGPLATEFKKQISKNEGNRTKQFYMTPQNKIRQSQKIKNIIQRLRKHPKFSLFSNHLNKLGLSQTFADIESQSKKNIHTIDTFRDRCMSMFNFLRNSASSNTIIQLIDEIIDQFMCYVQEAKKIEFETNLQNIQKSIDKITRQISDIRQQGNWYLKKKRKSQKNFDERQLMYISELIEELPKAYLVGIWEIIQQKPFGECTQDLNINLADVKIKKMRQIQSYVKRKWANIYKSRYRKKQKLQAKKKEKEEPIQKCEQNPMKQQQQEPQQKQKQILKSPPHNNGNGHHVPSTPTFNSQKNKLPTFKNLVNDSQVKLQKQINNKNSFINDDIDKSEQFLPDLFNDDLFDLNGRIQQRQINVTPSEKLPWQQVIFQEQYEIPSKSYNNKNVKKQQLFDQDNSNLQYSQNPPPSFQAKDKQRYKDINLKKQVSVHIQFEPLEIKDRINSELNEYNEQDDDQYLSDSSIITEDEDSDF